jgi:hypothetical protein
VCTSADVSVMPIFLVLPNCGTRLYMRTQIGKGQWIPVVEEADKWMKLQLRMD